MTEQPSVLDRVTIGLGWPRDVQSDPAIGWPPVSRETSAWPAEVGTLEGQAKGTRSASRSGGPTSEPVAGRPATPTPSSPTTASRPDSVDPADDRDQTRADDRDQTPTSGREPDPLDRAAPTGRPPTAAVTPVPTIPRPPGPRRARFDEDEQGPPPLTEEEDPQTGAATTVSRETSLPRPADTRVFVVANQKGGVGKTTSAVNLAAALALGGLSVLVVDLDPQGNASTALGVEHASGVPGTYEVLVGGDLLADHVVVSPEAPTLLVLPATVDLAGAELELVALPGRERRLADSLAQYLQDRPVDYVFLDCPPSLGLLTLNALVAASEILIPIQCEYYALEGVSQLVRTIDLVKGALNDQLRLSTVLLTMYDARTRLSAQVADEVRAHFSAETVASMIPRSVRISEAPSYGRTVLTYHPESAGAVAYLAAAQEIALRAVQGDEMTTTEAGRA